MASNVLTKKDYTKTALRAYWLQNGFNYNNYQGIGYANMLFPALRKIYTNDDDLREALKENIEFFNTNIHLVTFIANLHLGMLDNGQSHQDAKNLKVALMGPLAGVGDSISQFVIAPLFGSIGAAMAAEGQMFGAIFFLLGMNLSLLALKLIFGNMGMKFGTSAVATLTDKIGMISNYASMIGVAVIASNAVRFVKIKLGSWVIYSGFAADGTPKDTLIDLQGMCDKFAPLLPAVAYTALMYYLIKVKKWSTMKLIFLSLAIGIVGYYLGIFIK
jgi:PTS system N-acetylgalactosamine-specific IID component